MDLLDFGIGALQNYMPDAAYEEAVRRSRRMIFNDGQALHARGDAPVRLCIVASGAVRIGRFLPDGAFNLISIVGVGAHFGEIGSLRTVRTHNAYAVGRCEIDYIDVEAMEDLLLNQPGFVLGLWKANTARLNALLELYDDARTLAVSVRLAKVIYVHTGRGKLTNGVACLQRDLAELLGVSQVSIGNALRKLERARLVETGYRSVIVPDKNKLKAWLRDSNAT